MAKSSISSRTQEKTQSVFDPGWAQNLIGTGPREEKLRLPAKISAETSGSQEFFENNPESNSQCVCVGMAISNSFANKLANEALSVINEMKIVRNWKLNKIKASSDEQSQSSHRVVLTFENKSDLESFQVAWRSWCKRQNFAANHQAYVNGGISHLWQGMKLQEVALAGITTEFFVPKGKIKLRLEG